MPTENSKQLQDDHETEHKVQDDRRNKEEEMTETRQRKRNSESKGTISAFIVSTYQ